MYMFFGNYQYFSFIREIQFTTLSFQDLYYENGVLSKNRQEFKKYFHSMEFLYDKTDLALPTLPRAVVTFFESYSRINSLYYL